MSKMVSYKLCRNMIKKAMTRLMSIVSKPIKVVVVVVVTVVVVFVKRKMT